MSFNLPIFQYFIIGNSFVSSNRETKIPYEHQ
jgi:hypothetical protein